MKILSTFTLILVLFLQANAQLCGTYTVDAKIPTKKTNFNTLQEALYKLSYQSLDCDVIIELASGVYNQPIVLEGVQNDLGFNLLITNVSSETVTFENDGLSLFISNSSNVSISNITFKAQSTEMANMVVLSNSNQIVIENNNFLVDNISAAHKCVISVSNTSHDNNVSMNTIKGASGFEVTRLSNNNTISSNDVEFANTGITILSSLNTKVECNLFNGILAEYKKGIVLDGFVGNLTVTSNAILAVNEGISQLITYRPSANKLSGSIINNLIESKDNTVSLNNNVQNLQIAFNSFTSENASVIYFTEDIKESVSKITLFSNNLLNLSKDPIIYVENNSLVSMSDYNNIYNENGTFYTKVGVFESTNLATWKATMNAKNSISVDPTFVSFGKESYKLAENSPCTNTGPNTVEVEKNIVTASNISADNLLIK
jgi:hypothetical protein